MKVTSKTTPGEPAGKKHLHKLVFIYNAEGGAVGAIVDSLRKLAGLSVCPLCNITHSATGEKQEWQRCKEELLVPVEYYHKNDYPEAYREVVQEQLPCVLAVSEGEVALLLGPEKLKGCNGSVERFRGALLFALATQNFEVGI